jgi:hypothetical protein
MKLLQTKKNKKIKNPKIEEDKEGKKSLCLIKAIFLLLKRFIITKQAITLEFFADYPL